MSGIERQSVGDARTVRDSRPLKAKRPLPDNSSPPLATVKQVAAETVIEVRGLRPVVVFPREAVLEVEHVAAAFDIGVRSVERQHFPCFYLGTRTRRYLWGAVLDFCAKKSA